MGQIVLAQASSHAFTFAPPEEWDAYRAHISQRFRERHNRLPEENPKVAEESLEENQTRYARITDAIERLHDELAATRPDALILVGDDQHENFTEDYMIPQIAIYNGPDFGVKTRGGSTGKRHRSQKELADAILKRGVREGFDIASCSGFKGGELTSHAHYDILQHVVRDLDIPLVIVFVNALHLPTIEPSRCYALGNTIRRTVELDRPTGERVAIYGSGGLSHFTGGFPWKVYDGPFTFGAISESFDRDCVDRILAGEGAKLAELTSADLLHHGDVEMRSWIVCLGAVAETPATFAVYEPFYRGIMGMGVASWLPDDTLSRAV